MKWATPVHLDRSIYNRSAKALLSKDTSPEDFEIAAEVVSNWRAAHRYPLHALAMSLRGRVYKIDPKALVVQRAKRLASIIPKLSWMRLTQIQDIGGCRAVVRDLKSLNRVHARYISAKGKKDSRRPYMDGDPNNYIHSPKSDGYRGVHYVFRYRSDQSEYKCFNEMKVEIQLRTRAQHSWATAVEVVDIFTGQSLKSDIKLNKADPKWKRFFALMGTVIALKENCPPVPDTPNSKKKLIAELREIAADLDAVQRLTTFGRAITDIVGNTAKKGGAYLIVLDAEKRTLTVQLYVGEFRKNLEQDYIATETKNLSNPHVQVVQVNARSFDEFRRAYPNYDLDTSEFVQTLKDAIK